MARSENTVFDIDGLKIPVKIYVEMRNSSRVSVGKNHLIIRLPRFMLKSQRLKQIEQFKDWTRNLIATNKNIRAKFEKKIYTDDQNYVVGEEEYTLKIRYKERKSLGARILSQNTILLTLPLDFDIEEESKTIANLLSKIVSKHQLKKVSERIHYLNSHFFKVEIKSIKLKHNSTNWGSCSSRGNVNISSRLLFAPPSVRDYVYIHELAHFFEMNHSDRFWKIVRDIMPEYKEKEKWLKDNSSQCNF